MSSEFSTTPAAQDFISSGDSRYTDECVMRAISELAEDAQEAVHIWEHGISTFDEGTLGEFIKVATNDGVDDTDFIYWGNATLSGVLENY